MRTVTASKVSYAPIQSKKKDGELDFMRLGVKIELSDGNWWFYHFKFQSFSKHEPDTPITNKSGSPVYEPGGVKIATTKGKITRYGDRQSLIKRLNNPIALLTLLDSGIEQALADEAEKRAARSA